MLDIIEKVIDKFCTLLGYIAGFFTILMLFNVFADAIMRYFFRYGWIAFQEFEWHFFSIVFLLGMSYALKEDGHVRVDVLYTRFSPKLKATVNIIGTLVFLIPLALLIALGSMGFVKEAYNVGEISGDPGGLTHRYLIKAVIPISFVFLLVAAAGFVVRNIKIFLGKEAPHEHAIKDDVL